MTRMPTYGPPWALDGRSVLIVGLGRSGMAAARLAAREGARVTVTDSRPPEDLDTMRLSGLPVKTRLGKHVMDDFTGSDLIVVSPGVPLQIPELLAAREANVTTIGEIDLAASFLTNLPMIAVTGTNGKSTTTSLVGAMLKAGGMTPFVGGNLGRPLSEAVFDRSGPRSLALELSSFQLDTCLHLRPNVAVLLNLVPDHLDRHGSFEAYAEAKARIFMHQGEEDSVVVHGDDPAAVELTEGVRAKVHRFQSKEAPSFGAGYEASSDSGYPSVTVRAGEKPERYFVRASSLRGPHNLANAAAAALSCRIAGVEKEAVQGALDSFRGLPHRLERVRVLNGVEWINDSKATNPESARVGLLSFPGNVVWIAGGRGKGSDYSPLLQAASRRVKALISVGEDGPVIAEQAKAKGVIDHFVDAGTIDEAVSRAVDISRSGDVVLLSPACSSYDQFETFEHRGSAFKRLVEALS